MYSNTLELDITFDVPVRRPALFSRETFDVPVRPMDTKGLILIVSCSSTSTASCTSEVMTKMIIQQSYQLNDLFVALFIIFYPYCFQNCVLCRNRENLLLKWKLEDKYYINI